LFHFKDLITLKEGGEVNMAIEDAFRAAKTVLTLFDVYVNTVAQEIGRERAEALMTKVCEFAGAMQGMMMKKQSGIKEFDAKVAWSLAKMFKDNLGASHEVIEESPQRVVIRNGRCPIYEAAQTLGMEATAIETGCRTGPMTLISTAIKQLNPNLSLRVRKFRSTSDDFCEEEIILR
jgi:hypothetical protein